MPLTNPFSPPGMSQLRNITSDIGTTAQGLLKQRVPGVSKVRQASQALGKDPDIALPGGGTLSGAGDTRFGGGDVLSRLLTEEEPAATLPMYQAEMARRADLATMLGRAGALGAQGDMLQTKFEEGSMDNAQKLLETMGLTKGASALGTGGFGILGMLLGLI